MATDNLNNRKVLVLSYSLKIGGGAERAAVTTFNSISHQGVEVAYYVLGNSSDEYDLEGNSYNLLGNNEKASNFRQRLFFMFSRAYELSVVCRKNNFDTVVSYGEHPGFIAVISKLFFNSSKISLVFKIIPSTLWDSRKGSWLECFTPWQIR